MNGDLEKTVEFCVKYLLYRKNDVECTTENVLNELRFEISIDPKLKNSLDNPYLISLINETISVELEKQSTDKQHTKILKLKKKKLGKTCDYDALQKLTRYEAHLMILRLKGDI